jgi:UDP-glucose 4-epimerase
LRRIYILVDVKLFQAPGKSYHMNYKILITGSEGLVGKALRAELEARDTHVVGLDLVAPENERGDVRCSERVHTALAGCLGVVHLAAISRVVWGERDPDRCWNTNVAGFRTVVDAVERQNPRPWILFASSREVYGQPDDLPATEITPLRPMNVYGRSKVAGEQIAQSALRRGLRTAVVRLSNVYGSIGDHLDRVVPAFARAAILGRSLRVDGVSHTFDFTHLDDTIRGIISLIRLLVSEQAPPPPVQLVTGQSTSLGELAELAVQLAGGRSKIRYAEPRSYDVSNFYGSAQLALKLLGWKPKVGLREGLGRLIRDFQLEYKKGL